MHPYQIIPMTEAYIESYALALDSVARERQYIGYLEGPPIEEVARFVKHALQSEWIYYIAVLNDTVIGWCNIGYPNRPIYAHVGKLGIGIIQAYRSQGIGRALMKIAIEKAKAKGLTRIDLSVRSPNKPAIALYEKMGFVHEGVHKNAILMDGVYEDEYSMGLLLKS